jgi:CHASE2 domain-containing sensor protein
MNEKRLILWIMAFGALATFPWMARLGFDIGEFWNLLDTAVIGALLSGILGFLSWNIFRNARERMITCGIIAIVIIFVLSFLMMRMPVWIGLQ